VAEGLTIPLDIVGVCSGFESRKPTDRELDECPRIELTSDLDWEPNSDFLARREEESMSRNIHRVTFATAAQEAEAAPPEPEVLEALEGEPNTMVDTIFDEQHERMIAEYNHIRHVQAVHS
jgi:hypothetical protein